MRKKFYVLKYNTFINITTVRQCYPLHTTFTNLDAHIAFVNNCDEPKEKLLKSFIPVLPSTEKIFKEKPEMQCLLLSLKKALRFSIVTEVTKKIIKESGNIQKFGKYTDHLHGFMSSNKFQNMDP